MANNEELFQCVGTKSRLVHRVVDEIQHLIATGKLAPNMKLPPEREIAEHLGVSRTVVREAVQILVTKGLLESRRGWGTIVRQVTRDRVVEPLSWLLQSRGATMDHLHQVRYILETEIVRLAASQVTEEELTRLTQICEEMERCMGEVAAFVAFDADFHRTLAETAHNPLLIVLLDSIRDLMQEVRLQVHRHPAVYATIVPDHRQIVAAIQARDPDAATLAIKQHLDHARTFQREYLVDGR